MSRKETAKKYYERNKQRILDNAATKYIEDKKHIREVQKVYRETNKDTAKEYQKAYREANKNKRKEWIEQNKTNIFAKQKAYREANKEKFILDKPKRNAKIKERKATEPLYKLKTNIRALISISIRKQGFKRSSKKTEQILGCSIEQFKLHIESQFEPWMNWDNYGNPKDGVYELNKTWDIDHIKPVSKAITENDIMALNHFSNLKPLCTYVNRWIKRADYSVSNHSVETTLTLSVDGNS
jgi:hypothetical protein